jgi:hypothetical protein
MKRTTEEAPSGASFLMVMSLVSGRDWLNKKPRGGGAEFALSDWARRDGAAGG